MKLGNFRRWDRADYSRSKERPESLTVFLKHESAVFVQYVFIAALFVFPIMMVPASWLIHWQALGAFKVDGPIFLWGIFCGVVVLIISLLAFRARMGPRIGYLIDAWDEGYVDQKEISKLQGEIFTLQGQIAELEVKLKVHGH